MSKIKVLTIFGTRPEAVKLAPVIKELSKRENTISRVCVTGQHRQMLEQMLKNFEIEPDYDLDIMKSRQSLTDILTNSMLALEPIMKEFQPDVVLCQGDTSSTFAASLSAFYHKAKVGHIEAGLRTGEKYSPFPEEMNRVLTSRLADFSFAPTELNRNNLLKEGIPEESIFITGNTVIDALDLTVRDNYKYESKELKDIDLDKKTVLITAHRRENLGQPLRNICNAIKHLAEDYPEYNFIYPIHMNPAVREVADRILTSQPNVYLIEPLDVFDMHNLMANSHLILSDSGGIQEEAPSFDVPVIVLRTSTERPEALETGATILAGVEEENIYNIAKELLTDSNKYAEMAKAKNPYGDGTASRQIVDVLEQYGATETEPLSSFENKQDSEKVEEYVMPLRGKSSPSNDNVRKTNNT